MLLEQYAAIAATAEAADGDLRDVRWQIDQFLERFPADPRHGEVAALAQTIKLNTLEKRARRRILGNRVVPAIERDYRSAMAREVESPSAAVTALEIVSRSRISPTKITLGSSRRVSLGAAANDRVSEPTSR